MSHSMSASAGAALSLGTAAGDSAGELLPHSMLASAGAALSPSTAVGDSAKGMLSHSMLADAGAGLSQATGAANSRFTGEPCPRSSSAFTATVVVVLGTSPGCSCFSDLTGEMSLSLRATFVGVTRSMAKGAALRFAVHLPGADDNVCTSASAARAAIPKIAHKPLCKCEIKLVSLPNDTIVACCQLGPSTSAQSYY